MNKKLSLFLALTLLTSLFPWQPVQAQTQCRQGNPFITAYIRRNDENKRCEGIAPTDISSSFELVSFATGKLAPPQGKRYSLTVPNYENKQPKVRVLSLSKNYQLDPLEFRLTKGTYLFRWPAFVIEKEGINPQTLLAKAYVITKRRVYLPVQLGPANQYDIVLYANRRAKIQQLTIKQQDETIYQTTKNNWQPEGTISFSWNGKKPDGSIAPAEEYQLRVRAQLERDNRPPETATVNLTFAHNPQWLK